jgi:hypothetical protein
VPIPAAAPGDAPLLCLAVNAEWMQYVLGALKQLMLPATWGDAADPLVQAAQRAANDLIDLFAAASACGAGSVAGIYVGNCLAAPVDLNGGAYTDLLTITVTPGEYELSAFATGAAVASAQDVNISLWDGATMLAQSDGTPGGTSWYAAMSVTAHVAPVVDTVYTLKGYTDSSHARILADSVQTATGANVSTCLQAYPLGITGPIGDAGPPGPATQLRFTAGCGLEYSTDSGVTWLAVPGWLTNAPACFAGFAGAGIPASVIDPGSPPNPSDAGTVQRACNIAAYLATYVLQAALNKAASDAAAEKTALEFGVGLLSLIPGVDIGEIGFVAGAALLYNLTDGANLADYTAAAADETLWSAITCAIYGAIGHDGEVTAGNFSAVAAAIAAVPYAHADVPSTLAIYWGGLGINTVRNLQIAGALESADCTSCNAGLPWCYRWGGDSADFSAWTAYNGKGTQDGTAWTAYTNGPSNTELHLMLVLPAGTTLTGVDVLQDVVGPDTGLITLTDGAYPGGTVEYASNNENVTFPAIVADGFTITVGWNDTRVFQIYAIDLRGTGICPFGPSNC